MTDRHFYTTSEAAVVLGWSVEQVRHAIHTGELPAIKRDGRWKCTAGGILTLLLEQISQLSAKRAVIIDKYVATQNELAGRVPPGGDPEGLITHGR